MSDLVKLSPCAPPRAASSGIEVECWGSSRIVGCSSITANPISTAAVTMSSSEILVATRAPVWFGAAPSTAPSTLAREKVMLPGCAGVEWRLPRVCPISRLARVACFLSLTRILFDCRLFGRGIGAGVSSVEARDEVGGVGESRVPHVLRPADESFGDGARARVCWLRCGAALCANVWVNLRSEFVGCVCTCDVGSVPPRPPRPAGDGGCCRLSLLSRSRWNRFPTRAVAVCGVGALGGYCCCCWKIVGVPCCAMSSRFRNMHTGSRSRRMGGVLPNP